MVAWNKTDGLFNKAIMESGYCTLDPEHGNRNASLAVENTLCTGPNKLFCLRQLDPEVLVKASSKEAWYSISVMIDIRNPQLAPIFNEQPMDIFKSGKFKPIKMIIGTNADEAAYFFCNDYFGATEQTIQYVLSLYFTPAEVVKMLGLYPLQSYATPLQGFIAMMSDCYFRCPSHDV